MNCFTPKSLNEINEMFLASNPINKELEEKFLKVPEITQTEKNDFTIKKPQEEKQEVLKSEPKNCVNPVSKNLNNKNINSKQTELQIVKNRHLGVFLSIIVYFLIAVIAASLSLISWSQNTDTAIFGLNFYTLNEHSDTFEYEDGDLLVTKAISTEDVSNEVTIGKQIVFKKESKVYTTQIVTDIQENIDESGNTLIISESKNGEYKNEIIASDNMIKGVVLCRISILGTITDFLEDYLFLFLVLLGSLMIASILIQIIIYNNSSKKRKGIKEIVYYCE